MLYLDNAATTWPKPETVYKEVELALRMEGNPGRGVNTSSLSVSRILFEARSELAGFFCAPKAERIIFTQNATEGINLVLRGYLSPASNVLGTIQPLKEIGDMVKEQNLCFMVDAAQTAGVLPIDVQSMGIDFLIFTGHKGLLGPQGTGGVYVREGLQLRPFIYGGTGSHSASLSQPKGLPDGLESGTRNLPGIAGLLAGVKYCKINRVKIRSHEQNLMVLLLKYFKQQPQIRYYGPSKPEARVGLISFNIDGFNADQVGILLDRSFGIISRTGLHCAPLAHKVSGTLETGAVRISVGPFTSEEDINSLINALSSILGG